MVVAHTIIKSTATVHDRTFATGFKMPRTEWSRNSLERFMVSTLKHMKSRLHINDLLPAALCLAGRGRKFLPTINVPAAVTCPIHCGCQFVAAPSYYCGTCHPFVSLRSVHSVSGLFDQAFCNQLQNWTMPFALSTCGMAAYAEKRSYLSANRSLILKMITFR